MSNSWMDDIIAIIPERRRCETCRYNKRSRYKMPCYICFAWCQWKEPKKEESEKDADSN